MLLAGGVERVLDQTRAVADLLRQDLDRCRASRADIRIAHAKGGKIAGRRLHRRKRLEGAHPRCDPGLGIGWQQENDDGEPERGSQEEHGLPFRSTSIRRSWLRFSYCLEHSAAR